MLVLCHLLLQRGLCLLRLALGLCHLSLEDNLRRRVLCRRLLHLGLLSLLHLLGQLLDHRRGCLEGELCVLRDHLGSQGQRLLVFDCERLLFVQAHRILATGCLCHIRAHRLQIVQRQVLLDVLERMRRERRSD